MQEYLCPVPLLTNYQIDIYRHNSERSRMWHGNTYALTRFRCPPISFTEPSDRLYYYIITSCSVCLGISVLPIYTYRTIERNGVHPPPEFLINRNFSKRGNVCNNLETLNRISFFTRACVRACVRVCVCVCVCVI